MMVAPKRSKMAALGWWMVHMMVAFESRATCLSSSMHLCAE